MSNLALQMYGATTDNATSAPLVHTCAPSNRRTVRSRHFAARIAELKLRHGFSEHDLAVALDLDDKDAHTILTGKASAEHYAATLAKWGAK